ncbi:MAG: YceI family protein [Candidatus Sumerlaeia bacterium]|nr:YceI family protein [Candidatus Sumerlaeia bacterium]
MNSTFLKTLATLSFTTFVGALAIAQTQPATAPATASAPAVDEWVVDPIHSSIVFNIGHNGVSRVFGSFEKFSGVIKFSPENLAASSIEVSVETNSVDTNNKGRDEHIQDGEYLKVEANPVATFKSTTITAVDADTFAVDGTLTIAGATTPVKFNFDLVGPITDRQGGVRVGASTTFDINRTDYSIGKPQGLSPDVQLQVSLQAVKQ